MLDVPSYLLGKKAGGGSGGDSRAVVTDSYTSNYFSAPSVGYATKYVKKLDVELTEPGINYLFYQLSELEEVNIKATVKPTSMMSTFCGCSSLKKAPLFDTSEVTTFSNAFDRCSSLTDVPNLDTSSATTVQSMFASCTSLVKAPMLNIKNATRMPSMFSGCTNLVDVPEYDASGVVDSDGFSSVFTSVENLSYDSINNILAMCASATNFTGTKSLRSLGFVFGTGHYSEALIEGLPNYQAFVDAGWSLWG